MSSSATVSGLPWWGRVEIPDGQARRWRIGPFALTAHRSAPEWRIAYRRDGALQDAGVEVAVDTDPGASTEGQELLRVVAGKAGGGLSITPGLADRPVVARPETALRLLPDARVQLFLSTPAWIRIDVGEPPQQILDIPSWLLSDTWFGPSTSEGELGYAILTKARVHLENLTALGHRVVTAVRLDNQTGESFPLERLSLPAPNLSLHADADGRLWTQSVSVKLGPDRLAEVDLDQGPPAEARQPELVAGPRTAAQKNVLVRAVNALLL